MNKKFQIYIKKALHMPYICLSVSIYKLKRNINYILTLYILYIKFSCHNIRPCTRPKRLDRFSWNFVSVNWVGLRIGQHLFFIPLSDKNGAGLLVSHNKTYLTPYTIISHHYCLRIKCCINGDNNYFAISV